MAIQLVVGLGNPGPNYSKTRHNAGSWLVEELANQYNETFHLESKFQGNICRIKINELSCWLMIPSTFMNHSGRAILAMASFYKIPPQDILVIHDEIDFPPGVIKFKQSGGHGGHNGLRDTISQLSSNEFHRLRVGVGHPGDSKLVHDYVLNEPSKTDKQLIMQSIDKALRVLPQYITGEQQLAIQELHN